MKESFEKLYKKLVERTESMERALMTMSEIDPEGSIDQELLMKLFISCEEGKSRAKQAKDKMETFKPVLEQNKVEEAVLKLCNKNIEQAISLEMRANEIIKMAEKLIEQTQIH